MDRELLLVGREVVARRLELERELRGRLTVRRLAGLEVRLDLRLETRGVRGAFGDLALEGVHHPLVQLDALTRFLDAFRGAVDLELIDRDRVALDQRVGDAVEDDAGDEGEIGVAKDVPPGGVVGGDVDGEVLAGVGLARLERGERREIGD